MKNDFLRLKRKLFGQVLLLGAIALILCFFIQKVLIDGILQTPFSEGFIRFCSVFFRIDYENAVRLYQGLFMRFKNVYSLAGFAVLILVLFWHTLNRFTAYFTEISKNIDKLTNQSEEEIKLSPELDFIENKLVRLKHKLNDRERTARQAEARKNDLVVYLAHDMKTPLTSIIGYLNLLEEAPDIPLPQRSKYLAVTLKKAYRLEELMNEFFEITRFNLHNLVLSKKRIDLKLMLMQMADEFYPIAVSQGKQIQLKTPESIFIAADPDKLARVFNNLLKNAFAYSFENTSILVQAENQGSQVAVKIQNQGYPIPKQKLDRIFEKFFRLDEARSSQTGGSGLGLAIAKEIVTAHEGIITAESNETETTFTVTIPIGLQENLSKEDGRKNTVIQAG